MAGLTVEPKLRPCYVVANGNKQKALFHCWSFHSNIYSPSPLVGGHPGGVVARTGAIVELEDGSVTLIHPQNIKFVSGIFDEYVWDESEEEMKEGGLEKMKHEELLKEINRQIEENRYLKTHCMSTITDNVLRNNNNLLGKIKTVLKDADKDYERGCEDAWELARKISMLTVDGGIDPNTLYDIFGISGTTCIMRRYKTYKEALAKVEAYEKKQKEEESKKIVVGDVVKFTNKYMNKVYVGIIRAVDDNTWYIMVEDNWAVLGLTKSEWDYEKTGKHFDIQGMLDEIKTED